LSQKDKDPEPDPTAPIEVKITNQKEAPTPDPTPFDTTTIQSLYDNMLITPAQIEEAIKQDQPITKDKLKGETP